MQIFITRDKIIRKRFKTVVEYLFDKNICTLREVEPVLSKLDD